MRATIRQLCLASCVVAALALAGCGDDDDGDSVGDAAVDGNNNGPDASDPTVPAPQQDPQTMKWMCFDASGAQHVCQCNDGLDNDGDQTTDRLDPNCAIGSWGDSEAGSAAGGNCGTTQCTNCRDDDGDGKIDSADAECTGALDNSEASYATGIPGDNTDACKQDCFFDGNSGSGNDGCLWNLKCDPASPGSYAVKKCPYDSNFNNCPTGQSQMCLDYCGQYTPNGCDCFGCCSVYVNGTPYDVKLVPGCSAANITDTTACPRCTKTTTCNNPCEACEFCLGKDPDPSCAPIVTDGGVIYPDGGMTYTCPNNFQQCTPGIDGATCPAGYFCLTGCCVPNIN